MDEYIFTIDNSPLSLIMAGPRSAVGMAPES